MPEQVCLVGLEEFQTAEIRQHVKLPYIIHDVVPRIVVKDCQLLVQHPNRASLVPVSKVVLHGIFDDDMDFITGLAVWGGPCLPNALAMMDCRLKLPCLARALRHTRFGSPARGYAAPGTTVETDKEYVAKWDNWHCGENKVRFHDSWTSEQPSIIEPFFAGQAVRIVIVGNRFWQIRLEGRDWLKSIHDPQAHFMDIDPELLADTQAVRAAFGLEIIANDYIVADDGSKHLLEVNHIPNVTRFPEVWEAYRDYVVGWLTAS